eukprot:1459015-Rhodomonas_salina.8
MERTELECPRHTLRHRPSFAFQTITAPSRLPMYNHPSLPTHDTHGRHSVLGSAWPVAVVPFGTSSDASPRQDKVARSQMRTVMSSAQL